MKNSKLKRSLGRRASFLSFGNREDAHTWQHFSSNLISCQQQQWDCQDGYQSACVLHSTYCQGAPPQSTTSGPPPPTINSEATALLAALPPMDDGNPCKDLCDNCYEKKLGTDYCDSCDFCTWTVYGWKATDPTTHPSYKPGPSDLFYDGPRPTPSTPSASASASASPSASASASASPSASPDPNRDMPYYGAIKNSVYNYTCGTGESVGCLTDAGMSVHKDSTDCSIGSFLFCKDSTGQMKPQYGTSSTAKYRALYHQDVSESLQAWAERVRARSIAMEYGKMCTKVGSQVDDCYSRGKVTFSSCSHKALMWEDLHSNPILKYFVGATWGPPSNPQKWPDDSTMLKIETQPSLKDKNPMGLGYLKIPTTSESDPSWTYAARIGNNYTYEPKEINGEHIYMLIARKFTDTESLEIFKALTQQYTAISGTRLRNGYNFIFTPHGHISFRIGDQDQVTYYNPYIHSHASSSTDTPIANISTDPGRTDKPNTLSSSDINYGIRDFSAANAFKSKTIVYGHSAKVVMNRTSTYILYTPADDQKISSGITPADEKENLIKTNRYYLLYNPMHQTDFKKFYQAHIQIADGTEGTKPSTHIYKIAQKGAYGSTGETLPPPGGCNGPHYQIPSYKTIVSRYCNAFQMLGMGAFFGSHRYVKHYADPLCAFIQNKQLARSSFANNLNITPKTLTEVHYLNIPTTNATTEDAVNRFLYETEKQGSYFNSMSWGCPDHGADDTANSPTIYQWMSGGQYGHNQDGGMLGPGSTSFIKEFVTAMLQGEGDKFVTPIESHQSVGRRSSLYESEPQSVPPACRLKNTEHNTCNMFVSAAGDMSSVSNVQYMTCGSEPDSGWVAENRKCPDDCTTGACSNMDTCTKDTQPWHECKRLNTVPKCNNYDEDEGTPARWSQEGSRGKRWTACCLTRGGFDYISCREPLSNGDCEGRKNIADLYSLDVWDASNKPQFIQDFELKLEGLKGDLDRLGDTAFTFKTSYLKDPSIVDKAEELENEVKPAKAEINRIMELNKKTWVNKHNVDYKNADDATGIVATNIIDMERKAKYLITLVDTYYIKGVKKKYLYVGALAFILIILAILLI